MAVHLRGAAIKFPKTILFRDLNGAMRLDRSKCMCVHVSTYTGFDFKAFNASRVEDVALIRCVRFFVSSQK
jgi:hypothetical protein